MFSYWCECCALTAQIDHALEAAARVPELYDELRRACLDAATDA
jgi:hypothetical protein